MIENKIMITGITLIVFFIIFLVLKRIVEHEKTKRKPTPYIWDIKYSARGNSIYTKKQ